MQNSTHQVRKIKPNLSIKPESPQGIASHHKTITHFAYSKKTNLQAYKQVAWIISSPKETPIVLRQTHRLLHTSMSQSAKLTPPPVSALPETFSQARTSSMPRKKYCPLLEKHTEGELSSTNPKILSPPLCHIITQMAYNTSKVTATTQTKTVLPTQ